MNRSGEDLGAARERVASSLENLRGFALLTPRQQKLVRVALQMREMYPSGAISSSSEKDIVCYDFVNRLENEMMLPKNDGLPGVKDNRNSSFLFQNEVTYVDGKGNCDELVDSVRKFGYPAVVNFGTPLVTDPQHVTISHITVALGEENGEPILVNKDASKPFERVSLRQVIMEYEVNFTHRPNWQFGIRKLHGKDGIIEPEVPTR